MSFYHRYDVFSVEDPFKRLISFLYAGFLLLRLHGWFDSYGNVKWKLAKFMNFVRLCRVCYQRIYPVWFSQ